jgi:hypothetical protein
MPEARCQIPDARDRKVQRSSASGVDFRKRKTENGKRIPHTKYPLGMKILISLAVVAVIAGIVYKILTTEIPIDES